MGAARLGKEEMPAPKGSPTSTGQSRLDASGCGCFLHLGDGDCLPGRCPVVLCAVKQRPHVRLVPPGDVDHQHTCKERREGQAGPGVTPQCPALPWASRVKRDLPFQTGRRKNSAVGLEEGEQGVLGSLVRSQALG